MIAARIGYMFHIDPILVLNADEAEWLIRRAAASVIEGDIARQREKKK